ncbi:MAG: peptide chain release factor N(5)-glutamine methyltransferase [Breznakibacter sp.]
MTVREALRLFEMQLADLYPLNECRHIGKLFLGHRLNYSNTDFLTKGDTPLDANMEEDIRIALLRLKNGEPIQYILQRAWFMDMELMVRPGVLIPRPETEELVQWIVDDYAASSPNVLDIGTGSGCIAAGIARYLPAARVHAWDMSDDALAVASANARNLDVNVGFSKVDVLDLPNHLPHEPFNVIVSNPPYVTMSEKRHMHPNVLDHEPHLALFVDDRDALLFYRAIGRLGFQLLSPNGRLYFEINEAQGHQTVRLLEGLGYANVVLKADLQGKHRMVRADVSR